MDHDGLLTRRHILHAGRAFAVGGFLAARPIPAMSAEEPKALDHIQVINPSGLERLIMQNLLNDQKILEEFGLKADFVNVGDGAKILAALISGSGDICTGAGVAGLFPAIAKGAKLKILAGGAMKPTNAIFVKRDDIKEAKDLVGKTVGVGAPGALLHALMVAYLTKEGVDYKEIKFVNVGSSVDVFKAVLAGTVDAGPGDSNYVDQQAKYGVHVVKDGALWESLPEFTNTCIFATDATIAAKRDILVRMLAANAKLYRFMSGPQSKEAFLKARAEAFGKNEPEEAESQWRFYQSADTLANDLVVSEDRIRYLQRLNIELGVQQAILPFDEVADMSLAQEALKMVK